MTYEFMDTTQRNEVMAREGYYRDWSHIDANVFHQIMELVTFIREKGHGIDTREAISQAFERIYHDMSIDGNANMEVSAARGSFETLVLRLANMDGRISNTMSQAEFDSWVATLLDGGPSIFMDSLAMLQSTYPTGASGVALVRETDPAKIYVWDGQWRDFGEYQGIELKDGSVKAKNIVDGVVEHEKTSFAEKGEIKNEKLVSTFNLSDYRNTANDGTIILATGEIRATESTAYLTTTNIVTFGNATHFRAYFRAALFYDKTGNATSYLENTGLLETPFEIPSNSEKVILSVPIDKINVAKFSTYQYVYSTKIPTLDLEDESVDSSKLAPKSVIVEKTDFLEYADIEVPGDGVYKSEDLINYHDELRDGYMIQADGQVLSTSATAYLTTTKPVPIYGDAVYKLIFRSALFYDIDNNLISGSYLSNTGLLDMEFTAPASSKYVIFSVPLERVQGNINTIKIKRLTAHESDRPYKFKRPIVGLGGAGEAYDQSLNTTDDVKFNSVTAEVISAKALDIDGDMKIGTLSTPPSGLEKGEWWADTTDSTAHPVLRVML